jgi:hypothetical protein
MCGMGIWSLYETFRYMRPVLSIDASHLRGRYERRMLVAVGYDTENQLLPLTFGLVEKTYLIGDSL